MTIPNPISRTEIGDGAKSIGRGRVVKQASTSLALIENKTADLAAHAQQAMTQWLTSTTARTDTRGFLAALALSRIPRDAPTIEMLERFAPQWTTLTPANPNIRAAIAYWLGQKYRFTYPATPQLRAALGLDSPTVQNAYQQLFTAPLVTIFATDDPPAVLESASSVAIQPFSTTKEHTQGPAATLGLQVVAAEKLFPHEYHDPQRVARLATRISTDGLLANPPLVVALPDGAGFMVLDGATRTTAFQQLGYPHIVVQVVDPQQGQVQLNSWAHAVRGVSAQAFLALAQAINGLRLTSFPCDQLAHALWERGALGYLITADEQGFLLEHEQTSHDRDWLDALNELVNRYSDWGRVERTLVSDVETLRQQFSDLAGLVVFPQFSIDVVLQVVAKGRLLPAGLTRFLVTGRVLRLNLSLARLTSVEPIAAKRAWLDQLVQLRLAQGAVRHYQESVILFDE